MPLARTTVPPGQVGHLSLEEDYKGLLFSAQLDREDDEAQTVMRRISAGPIAGASFAFRVTKQTWSDDRTLRTIQAVDINRGDVAICNQGANDAAFVDARLRAEQGANDATFYRLLAQASALGATPRHHRRPRGCSFAPSADFAARHGPGHQPLAQTAQRSGAATMTSPRISALLDAPLATLSADEISEIASAIPDEWVYLMAQIREQVQDLATPAQTALHLDLVCGFPRSLDY